MKRVKSDTKVEMSREDVETIVGSICELTIRQDALKARMDDQIKKIRDQYMEEFAEIGSAIDAKMMIAQDWAEQNPEEFGSKKSIEMTHAVIGFRTGMPQLKTIKGWTWDRVLDYLRNVHPGYVRRKEEVDKDAIISSREMIGDSDLKSMGCRVVQVETFFVEPKRETVNQAA